MEGRSQGSEVTVLLGVAVDVGSRVWGIENWAENPGQNSWFISAVGAASGRRLRELALCTSGYPASPLSGCG